MAQNPPSSRASIRITRSVNLLHARGSG
jgi:hypothetical protein